MIKRLTIASILIVLLMSLSLNLGYALTYEEDAPDVSAQDLLKPDMFPDAQMGMEIKSVQDGAIAKVVTTGGEFLIDKAKDTVECRQLISKQRTVGTVKLPKGTLAGIKLTHKSSGAAIFTGSNGIARINGDSLLMVEPKGDGEIKAELAFTPDYHREFHGNYNFFDPSGGISFYEHGKCPNLERRYRHVFDVVTKGAPPKDMSYFEPGDCPRSSMQAAKDPVTVTWPWKGGDVFWAGVSPPRPYDWNYPLKNKSIRWGAQELPSDSDFARYAKYNLGNSLLYQHEMNKHWQLDYRMKDPDDVRRAVKAAHDYGIKIMIYLSPHYYTKGTPYESMASHDRNCPGWHSGSNEAEYIKEATRLIREYDIDGLYWDGMYEWAKALAVNYHVARTMRAVVGEDNPYEFHGTTDIFGEGHTGAFCPTMNAYFDYLLKNEGEEERINPGYLRYQLSTYNTSNSIAIACWFYEAPPPEVINILLDNNVHLHLLPEYMYWGQDNLYRKYYWPRLTPALKDEILPKLMKPTGDFERFRRSISAN